MTIALTGGTGLIGSYLRTHLSMPMKCLTRKKEGIRDHTWVCGSFADQATVDTLIDNCSVLVHLACTTTPHTSDSSFQRDLQDNLLATVNLFEQFAKRNPSGQIIYCSTGGNLFSAIPQPEALTEEAVPNPRSSYGIHKLAAEHYLRLICEKYGISGTILRVSNPFGVVAPTQRTQGLIGVAFRKIIDSAVLDLYEPIENVRDYVHLDDVTQAFRVVIASPAARGACRIFHIGTGVGVSTAALLEEIEKCTERTLKKQLLYPATVLPTWNILSHKKIHNELGWRPETSLSQGLAKMWREISRGNV